MYSINGLFLYRNITGVERYAIELIKNLDRMIKNDSVEIVLPYIPERLPIEGLHHIKYKSTESKKINHNIWEQVIFPFYLLKNKSTGINLCNSSPLLKPDVICIHDIFYRTFPDFFTSKTSKKMSLRRRTNYWFAGKLAKKIVTVSEFSKKQLVDYYHIDRNRIFVSKEGWEHNADVISDDSVFERFPQIQKGEFFFSLGQISPHKNMKWVFEVAKRNPKEIFVVTGKNNFGSGSGVYNLPDNVILTGYLSDGEVAALMNGMKALLFPSYCEGFGIPPMEALHKGKKVLMSNRTCLPEIYNSTVVYIEPDDYSIDLNHLLEIETTSPKILLENYTWKNTAKQWKLWLNL